MGADFLAKGNGRGFFLTAFYRHVSVRTRDNKEGLKNGSDQDLHEVQGREAC